MICITQFKITTSINTSETKNKSNINVAAVKTVSIILITAKKISENLSISQRQVERVISDLKIRGVIERVGARKNGYWKIIK